jgi:PAS domain S-box-containing protein
MPEAVLKRRTTASARYRELDAKFTALTSSTRDAMIMIDEDGIARFWNRAAERMFGYRSDEIIGKVISDFIVPAKYYDRHVEGLKHFKQTGKGRQLGNTLELSAVRRTSEEFPIEISYYSSPIQLDGRWHAVAIIRDITARKRAEAEVERVKSEWEREHKEAEDIGRSLLGGQPVDPRWAAFVKVEPCSRAGGDRAGFLSRTFGEDRANEEWLVVFDASGHGKGAAKFQEVFLGGLIALLGTGLDVKDSLEAINRLVLQIGTGRFLVGNLLRVMRDDERPAENGVRWIEEFNVAQHNVLVLDPDAPTAAEWQWERQEDTGASLPIGLFDNGLANLMPAQRRVRIGSRILTYTDGVSEAENPHLGEFGTDRLRDILVRTRGLSLRDSYRQIVRSVRCWTADLPPDTPDERLSSVRMQDDMTLALLDITV